ncbi:MAG: PPC domain-containing protein [Anaerolineae bacterium]|nr:PPC domain-containing protein [Anaerolineae bacterium]
MNLLQKRLRVFTILLIVVSTLMASASLLLAQEGSRQLIVGTPVTAELDATTFAQTYWFEGLAGQEVTLFASTADEGLALAMLLTDAGGAPLAQDADPETPSAASVAAFLLPVEGRYYVTVMRLSGAEGDGAGTFTLTFVIAGQGQVEPTEAAPTTEPVATAGPSLVTLDAGIQVSASWNSTADLDLEVRDPFGNSIYWENPTAENAIFDRNINANCEFTTADNPTERVNWTPGASPVGSYEIIVYYVQGCDNTAPANVTLNVTVNGVALPPVSGAVLAGQEFLSSFKVEASAEASAGLSGVNPGLTLANASSFLTGQTPLSSEAGVTGAISADSVYQSFSFTGTTGQLVTLRMDATSGNLDPLLFLVDPNGIVVASSDDAATGDTINSEISNWTLVSDGLYTVVATRYGLDYGGTEGEFVLTLSGGSTEVPAALAALNLPQGSIEVSLLWNTNADLQLLVRDPSGASIYDDVPSSANTGGQLAEDGNVNCAATTTTPVSYIYWPADRLPPGTYEVEVWYQSNCGDTTPVTFTLTVRINDQVVVNATAQPAPDQVYLTTFSVDVNGGTSAGAGGFIGGSSVLDVGQALLGAIPVEYGDIVSGTINQSSRFVVYTFEGAAGDQVRIGMDTLAGTLDTTLYLLSPDGAELAANDDAVVNETTNSLISSVTLPSDGTYIIIATHYGLLYGGTSGTYNLTLTRLN